MTINDAHSYFTNERLFADAWDKATEEQQHKAMNMAFNQINRLNLRKDVDLDNEDNILRAICEQALYLLETQNSNRSKLIEQGVTSFSVEGLSESYDPNKTRNSSTSKICSESIGYLRPYMIGCAPIC